MSLLKRKQAKEQEAAEESDGQKLHGFAIHPIIEKNFSRDVCDAYFQGLVCAAFADNERLDKSELSILNDIGVSLGMQVSDVDDALKTAQTIVDDVDKFESLIKECLLTIKGSETIVKLFYTQFAQIWISHGHESKEDLYDTFAAIDASEVTGVAFPKVTINLIKRVCDGGDELDANLLSLSEWMGEDALKYFASKQYGDVSGLLETARKNKEVEAEANRKADVLKAEAHKVKSFYEKMRNFVAKYVDKCVSRDLLFEMGDELADAGFDKINPQDAFKEIAAQMLSRVEALALPEIWDGDLPIFHRDVIKRDGSDLTEDECNRFIKSELIAKETVWIVIGLCCLMFRYEELPIGKVNAIVKRAHLGIKFDSDMRELWAKSSSEYRFRDIAGGIQGITIEDVFIEVLGVQPVWNSLFDVTNAQRNKLDDWAERRGRRYGGEKLKDYARSIGVSWVRWCGDFTFKEIIESVVLRKTSRDL